MLLRVMRVPGLIRAEHALLVGQQVTDLAQRASSVTAVGGPGCDVVPGVERVGVSRAQHALTVGRKLPVQAQPASHVAASSGAGGDVAPGSSVLG
jgi:hypothetical protein